MNGRTSLTIVLAAGEGTRMRSSMAKVLHSIAGQSLLAHVLAAAPQGAGATLAVSFGGSIDVDCLELGRAGFAGPVGLALAVVPVVLLLICADGMRHGRRLALRIAVLVQLAVTVMAAVYLSVTSIASSAM